MERIGEKGRIHGHLLKSAVSLFFCVFGVDCNDTVKNTILSGSPAKKITDLEARISNLEKQKDNIVEPRVSGIVSKEDCEKKYASITKEIEMAKGELDRHQDRKREQSEMKGKRLRFLCATGRFISTIDFLICLLSLQIFRKYKKLPR